MKIGILTYQNTQNFGAALQCYALYKSCMDLNHEVEIIDYRNEIISNKIKNASKKNIKYILLNKKKKAFEKFSYNYLKLSSNYYESNKQINENPPKYDQYIIGSDQVWNYNINGMDTTYFMDFVKDNNKIMTFASSFGLDSIKSEYIQEYFTYLNRIPVISVREAQGQKIIKDLLKRDVPLIADPVFLLSKNEWVNLIDDNESKKNDYICTYFLNNNTRAEFEKQININNIFSRKNIYKLAGGIKIKDLFNPKLKVNFSNGPLEFIKSIYKCEYVFTDSFHATVFAIILNKKFMVFLSGDKGRDSRIVNLLEVFNLSKCIFKDKLEDININYYEINKICNNLKKESKEYLTNNINK